MQRENARRACLLLVLVLAGNAFGLVTRYIGPSRSSPNFTDVTSACNWLNNNATTDAYLFLIDAGSYAGACSLYAVQSSTTTFAPTVPGSVVQVTATNALCTFLGKGTNNVKLDSLRISNSSNLVGATAVCVQSGTGWRFLGDSITMTGVGQSCHGVMIQTAGNAYDSVVNCKVSVGAGVHPSYGIFVNGSAALSNCNAILGSSVYVASQESVGVFLDSTNYSVVRNCVVSGAAGVRSGIGLKTASGNWIQGDTITGLIKNGIYLMAGGASLGDTIVGCWVLNTGATSGIRLNSGSGHLIANNVIRGWGAAVTFGAAIHLTATTNSFIYYNTAVGRTTGTSACVQLATASTGNTFKNNVFRCGFLGSYCYYLSAASNEPVYASNNDLYSMNHDSVAYVAGATVLFKRLSEWALESGLPDAGGSILSEPALLPDSLHLQGFSPCANAGTAISGIATDIEGDVRPIGSQVDIGADELRLLTAFGLSTPRNDSLNAPTTIDLYWNASANAGAYDIFWGTTSGQQDSIATVAVPTLTFNKPGLANAQDYYWYVRARNANGSVNSTAAPWHFQTVVAAPQAFTLDKPRNDSLNAPTMIDLSWNASTNAVVYDIFLGTTSVDQDSIATVAAPALTFNKPGLANDQDYYWYVRARNISGSVNSVLWHFRTIVAAPQAFTLATPKNDSLGAPTTVSLNWNTSTGAAVYDIFLGTSSGHQDSIATVTALTQTFTESGLSGSQDYYWYIRARNVAGSVNSTAAPWHFRTAVIAAAWNKAADVLPGGKNKNVKDGGCLTYAEGAHDSNYVYALKGNNTFEFYRYTIAGNLWDAKESIPAIGRTLKKKGVKKGGALATVRKKLTDDPPDWQTTLYATKGNNTLDFWQYDPAPGVWTQKADVPTGSKNVREGTGMAHVKIHFPGPGADTNYVYLLKGSGTYEFYRYNTEANSWETMANAPGGNSTKPYKNGSSITYDNNDTIWCLKGSYNELFAYSISGKDWVTKDTLPKRSPPGTKKTKVKDGSQIAYAGRVVYALKGGNTNEFWMYRCDEHTWYTATELTVGSKKVKGGGALVYAGSSKSLYALRGNNTREFWSYGPIASFGFGSGTGNRFKDEAQSQFAARSSQFALRIAPNPFTPSLNPSISYSLPVAGNISLKLYDVTGQLVSTLASGYHPAGSYSSQLTANSSRQRLAAGIYMLRLDSEGNTTTQKLIIE
jgi:hypothetical protein